MQTTYLGILRDGRIEWTGDAPATNGHPLRVSVTVLEEPAVPRRKSDLPPSEPLERIAALGGVASIPDPSAWQREIRQDRPLPGREEE